MHQFIGFHVRRAVARLPIGLLVWTALMPLSIVSLASSKGALHQPTYLVCEPNALQSPDGSLRVTAGPFREGELVTLEILRDCARAESTGHQPCLVTLLSRKVRVGADSRLHGQVDFKQLKGDGTKLPPREDLKLRVYFSSDKREFRTFRFSIADDPCSVLKTVMNTVFGGECDLNLGRVLIPHRGPASRLPSDLEVRRLRIDSDESEPIRVPGTSGATGVAWLDDRDLLVTIGPPDPEAFAGPDSDRHSAGLFRVALNGSTETLWEEESSGWTPAAPLALSRRRVAFVRQRLEGRLKDEPGSFLMVLDSGTAAESLALPFPIERLVASDRAGRFVLAFASTSSDAPANFLWIDLKERDYESVGYADALLMAAGRSPASYQVVLAIKDNFGETGWDINLLDRRGRLLRQLVSRAEDDLYPVWKPDGTEIAYLSEPSKRTARSRSSRR